MGPAYETPQLTFTPNITGRLPTLGPSFVNPDDAARFAHELIGDHRGKNYYGVILKNAQDRYIPSRPIKADDNISSYTQCMSTNAKGELLHPAGYTCYAFYSSRVHQLAIEQTSFQGAANEELIYQANFFLPEDIHDFLGVSSFAPVHYFSGFNGSLLKVVSSGTTDENVLRHLLIQAMEDNDVQVKMLSYIKQVTDTLLVSVIQSADVWAGHVGPLTPEFFTASREPSVVEGVIVQRPALGPLLNSEQLALEYARLRSNAVTDQHYGFILKSLEGNTFIVTQPLTGQMDFDLARAFPAGSDGHPELPSGFAVVALYGSDGEYRDPAFIPKAMPSVYKNFMHIEALAEAILKAQELTPASQTQALPVYIVARDGALLKYVSRFSNVEKTLFARLPKSKGGGIEVLQNVLSGVETIDVLIHALAHGGDLAVLRRSDIWGREGKVFSTWQPFEGFMRRTLSPVFIEMDDAARYAHEQIARRTDFTYGGLILLRDDNRYVATEPLAVTTETFDSSVVFPPEKADFIPWGCQVIATYQTHRVQPLQLWRSANEERIHRNMFEPHEMCAALRARVGSARYFSAQDGALLKYTPSGVDQEKKYLPRVTPPDAHPEQVYNNSIRIKLRTGALKPSQYVTQVARVGDLRVVVASPLWGGRGEVKPDWKPAKALETGYDARLQPALTPLFTQAQAAARYVHERMGARSNTQFGVILKSLNSGHYMATEPLPTRLALLGQLFPRPFGSQSYSLPEGFVMDSVYMATPKEPVARVSDDIYADFIAPTDLVNLAVLSSTVRDKTPGRYDYPHMFISTRDGALLSYRADNLNTVLDLDRQWEPNTSILELLKANKLPSPDYVRKVAASGHLDVLLTDKLWATPGRVTSAWRPYALEISATTHAAPNVPALGPVFSHIDDAALYSHRKIQHPYASDVVGALFFSSTTHCYVPLEPVINGMAAKAQDTIFLNALVERATGQSRPLPVLPTGYSPVAVYYVRCPVRPNLARPQQRNWVDHTFWPVDICFMTKSLKRLEFSLNIAFASGNEGSLLKFVGRPSSAEDDLCELVTGYDYWENQYLNQDWVEKGKETEREYIGKLVRAGELVVVEPGEKWSRAGWITADWKGHESVKVSPQLPWLRSPMTVVKDEL
ncbi:hypothetical protein SB766_07465 [Pseudomonas sp. SIMBA_077]